MKKIKLQDLLANDLLELPPKVGSFSIHQLDLEKYRNKGGIYCFKKGEDYLYIGISKDLGKRLKEHLLGVKGRGNKNLRKFLDDSDLVVELYFEENRAYQEIYESYLIINKEPKLNKLKTGKPFKIQSDKIGRPKMDVKQYEKALSMYFSGEYTVQEILETVKISKATLYRKISEHKSKSVAV